MDRDVWVDFNDIDDQGAVTTLVKFASRPLEIGEQVVAGDDEGNRCYAIVVSVDGPTVTLALDLGSFKPCDGRSFAGA